MKLLLVLLLVGVGGSSYFGCSGMSGLGGPAVNFADKGGTNGDGDKSDDGSQIGNSLDKPGDPGNGETNTGNPPAAAQPPPAGPTMTQVATNSGDPFGGYRPGNEGHVVVGPPLLVVTSSPSGASNCGVEYGMDFVPIFPTGTATPTIYSWYADDPNGPFNDTGHMTTTDVTGSTPMSCYDQQPDSPAIFYKYAMLLASFTDDHGKVYRSKTLTVECKPEADSLITKVCLPLEAPEAAPVEFLHSNLSTSHIPLQYLQNVNP